MASSCSMMRTVAILSLCAVFLMVDVQAQCTLNDMEPCMNAVTSGAEPTEPCCQKVATVDVACFCNLVKDGNYPQEYVNNAMTVPAKCGGDAYAHFKGQNCAGHKIN